MTLLELLELLRKKWYLVVILPLLFAGAAAYCWGFMTNNYTASVSLYVLTQSSSRVITLTVTGKNPDAAARVANELADRTSEAAVEAMKLEAVNVIDRATAPDKPSGPNRTMYTLVALLAGLFVAIAIIVLLDMLDNTVKSGEDAEELLGLPVLSRMPEVNGKGK